MPADGEELIVRDAKAWRRWLAKHGAQGSPVWLVLARKGVVDPTELTYQQALEEALCFGWIDGQKASRDAHTFAQRFTPRRLRSPWSARNVELIAALIADGRMTPAGQLAVDEAKADGRWDRAYPGQAGIQVPSDFAAELKANPRAAAMFEILTRQNRYSILLRIASAKRQDTRLRRVEQYIAMLDRGETIYPQKQQLDQQ